MRNGRPEKPASKLTLAVGAVILATAGILRVHQYVVDRKPVLAKIVIDGRSFTVEVADTPGKQELGLGKRDSLSADRGMYFPFAAADYWIFWMKDMRFPIDIVWIRDGKVVDVSPDAPVPKAGETPATFSPVEPADAVLEVDAGTAASIGLKPGDAVNIQAGTFDR